MANLSATQQSNSIPSTLKFIFGGSAGMGACLLVQPFDLLKNRMQLSGENGSNKQYKNSLDAAKKIVKTEGFAKLYTGLSAGLLRQATYTTCRMGIYQSIFDKLSQNNNHLGFMEKAAIGIFAGAISAFIGTPTEVALIRMTADGKLAPTERRNYKNVFNALYRICKEESIRTLWKGATPTIGRAMIVNGAQLASYSQAKENLTQRFKISDGIFLHFCSSIFAGFITALASCPIDIIKTRIQKSSGTTNTKSIFLSIIKNEGFFALWKGFTPYFSKLGPSTVLTFVFLEQLNSLYRKMKSS